MVPVKVPDQFHLLRVRIGYSQVVSIILLTILLTLMLVIIVFCIFRKIGLL